MSQDEPKKYDASKFLESLQAANLRDNSSASLELRRHLRAAGLTEIEAISRILLSTQTNGRVFQDLVNNLGERIGFEVEYGLYQGVKNAIGFDGYWRSKNSDIVVECKTTDAFRISTDVLLRYAERLRVERNLKGSPSILLVVGRFDTGDLESQIRGSRADDRIGVIGIGSLLSLVGAVGELTNGPATEGLRSLLIPRDYTRLDELSRLITNVINEAQYSHSIAEDLVSQDSTKIPFDEMVSSAVWYKAAMVSSLEEETGVLDKITASKSHFTDQMGQSIFIAASKRYQREDQQYWFSIPKDMENFWRANGGRLLLGLVGSKVHYDIPWDALEKIIVHLNEASRGKRDYFHLGLKDTGQSFEAILPKLGKTLDISRYEKVLMV